MARDQRRSRRWHRYWDKKSTHYDSEMDYWDRKLFGDTREWVCSKASGDVLEVAVGTGLNLPLYPGDAAVTGIDLSDRMLDIARARAGTLGASVTLRQADAHALPFDSASFDTVICTFGLCAIPDPDAAVDEMVRVLRPDGRLILADHIGSSSRAVRALQRVMELVTVPMAGEHFLRRPSEQVRTRGLVIEMRERFKLGLVERIVAHKPAGT